DNPAIEEDRPVVDVVQVVLRTAVDLLEGRGFAAEAVHLGPTGDTGLDALAVGVLGELMAELVIVHQRMRAGTDEAHFTAQHVDQLRQLVDGGAPGKGSDSGDAGVAGADLRHLAAGLGDRHRAEFPDVEGLAVEAATLLTVEDRARAVELDPDRN